MPGIVKIKRKAIILVALDNFLLSFCNSKICGDVGETPADTRDFAIFAILNAIGPLIVRPVVFLVQ